MESYEIKIIERNVFMENESRRILNKIMPIVKEELKPYLNKKVLKVNNELLKEIRDNSILRTFKEIIKPLIKGDFATISHLFIDISPYTLNVKLSLCFNGGSYDDNSHNNNSHYCYYWENYSNIGDVDNNKLTKVKEYEERKEVNKDEEIKIYIKAKRLKTELDLELNKFKLHKHRDLV